MVIPSIFNQVLSVIFSKDQARSMDQGGPIPSKFSPFFLCQIRLQLLMEVYQISCLIWPN